MNHKAWRTTELVALVVIVLIIPLSWLLNNNTENAKKPVAVFTGGKACIGCHQKEYRLWKGSDHDLAMAVASVNSVEGDFNNAELTHNGRTSKFFKRSGKFFVYTEGPGGIMKEFQVTHTFGTRPLQQYLIPFEKGKFQCLPIAWNTLEKKWFHLAAMVYKPEDLKPDNWLYWTNQAQNWNSMCAECHSTNLQKNFNPDTKSYHTTWTDINVNCESCHGPGSAHIKWAGLSENDRPRDNNAALIVKTSKVSARQYVGSCAPCHARRSSLGPYDHQHNDFLSYAVPQLPTTPAYYIDGQIRDEDYEYGSFTQSKMYMKGVRCGNCHDPHSLKRKFEGNALCTQCHKTAQYDTFNHHKHKSIGEAGGSFINQRGEKHMSGDGTRCRDCHTPGRYYMGVDKRFDHSFRIPRPDLTIQLGTPNACTNCHDNKTAVWALGYVNKWYGEKKKPHYGTLLADGAAGTAGADSGLLKIVYSNVYPAIIKATALGYLTAYGGTKTLEAVNKALHNPDHLLRFTAVKNYPANDSAAMFRNLAYLLNDPVKSVRMEAALRLMTFKKNTFHVDQYGSFQKALAEYKNSLEYVADFPTGRYNLGNFYARLNDQTKAAYNYKEAIAIDNLFYPAKVNLAMIYYRQGKKDQAANLFRGLVSDHPDLTDGYYYLALLYGEQQRYPEAVSLLVQGLEHNPVNFDLLYALYAFNMKQNKPAKAATYLEKLKKYFPAQNFPVQN